jgi:AcrR family transcriptional regulator
MITDVESSSRPVLDTRERILESAYDLFSHRGIRAVGTEELIANANVAKATFYRHFPTKDDLVLAFLRRREQVWVCDWVMAEAKERGATPEQQLLVIFDLFDEWFATDDFEGCSFINVLLEITDSEHPVRQACVTALEDLRTVLSTLAAEAGLSDPDEFALCWHILMKGSIVQAAEGDLDAAKRAQAMGRLLIDYHRPSPVGEAI